jgi:hypothetical protein
LAFSDDNANQILQCRNRTDRFGYRCPLKRQCIRICCRSSVLNHHCSGSAGDKMNPLTYKIVYFDHSLSVCEVAEILLKLALSTNQSINQSINQYVRDGNWPPSNNWNIAKSDLRMWLRKNEIVTCHLTIVLYLFWSSYIYINFCQ